MMNYKTSLAILLFSITFLGCNRPTDHINLAGHWMVKLDSTDGLANPIYLPGTTDEAGLGNQTTDTAYGILSREFEFVGKAWYTREINIPKKWHNEKIDLFLERVLWESTVFIDGKQLDSQDGLGTPHIHHLGSLSPGKHELTLLINNNMIHNIGDKGHAYGEYMQSIWNGVVGRLELRAYPDIRIERIITRPDLQNNQLQFELIFSERAENKDLVATLYEKNTGGIVVSKKYKAMETRATYTLKPNRNLRTWDEYDPFLYELEIVLDPEGRPHKTKTTFGFSTVSKNQHHLLINNRPVFLRGNLDCIHFPNTGYPSTHKEDWLDIFQTYKDYGLNHVRFHSWCPPEAAFEAADELGIYIQAEASVWIDWWMGTDMISRGRPEMETKGHPQGIGQGDPDADEFIWKEMNRVIDTYGNHPSFVLFCIGNELGSSDFEVMGDWIRRLKEKDPRRLYAASTARTITEWCDYSATHNVPGIGGVRQQMHPSTDWNYEERYSRAEVPIIAHEIGQWPVYPEWNEIKKYTGPLKPRNLTQLANLAKKNSVYEKDKLYRKASGSLSALLYKDEVESFMRTPSCAGFQLLSMQDYIGQGEALIGWLDSFYEEKGNLDPESARQFINAVVPLAELPGYWYRQGEKFVVPVLLFQYSAADSIQAQISWHITNPSAKILTTGTFESKKYSRAKVHEVGPISWTIPADFLPGKYILEIAIPGTTYTNKWPFWIYPDEVPFNQNSVILTRQLNEEMLNQLQSGARVLFIADQTQNPAYTVNAAWKPLYWSASFFPGQSIETLGSSIHQSHPALANFPTDDFANWNWYRLCEGAKCYDLKDFPPDYDPIIEPVSDFHYCRRLGSLFELKVGKGKLLVCGYNILENPNQLPEFNQLKYSLMEYMNSEDFQPETEIPVSLLKKMFAFESIDSSHHNNPQNLPGGNQTH